MYTARVFTLSACIVMAAVVGHAQPVDSHLNPVTIPGAGMLDWFSTVVHDSLRTYVFLPPGYGKSDRRYPVLYLTDGDWQFTGAINAFSNLKQDYFVIEPVIIAIGYGSRQNKRDRDLDPDHGAARFLECIKTELIPWVYSSFKTSGDNALYGYSLGGKFATFALFTEPQLFSALMIGSPADHGIHLMPAARGFTGEVKTLPGKIFVGTGEYERETVENIEHFRQWALDHAPTVRIITATSRGMNHGAAISAVIQEALRNVYVELKQEIKVPLVKLKAYAGKYLPTDNTEKPYEVFVKDGRLQIVLHGYRQDNPFMLHPLSATTFFIEEDQRLLYTFEEQQILKIRLPDGREIVLRKKS